MLHNEMSRNKHAMLHMFCMMAASVLEKTKVHRIPLLVYSLMSGYAASTTFILGLTFCACAPSLKWHLGAYALHLNLQWNALMCSVEFTHVLNGIHSCHIRMHDTHVFNTLHLCVH